MRLFLDARTSLLCFQGIRSKDSKKKTFRKTLGDLFFLACRFPLFRFTKLSRRREKTLLSQNERNLFGLCENVIATLGQQKKLCVRHPATRKLPFVRGYKILRERIHCSYSKVIDRLFMATNQSIHDNWQQTLLFDSSQLAHIRDPTMS